MTDPRDPANAESTPEKDSRPVWETPRLEKIDVSASKSGPGINDDGPIGWVS